MYLDSAQRCNEYKLTNPLMYPASYHSAYPSHPNCSELTSHLLVYFRTINTYNIDMHGAKFTLFYLIAALVALGQSSSGHLPTTQF